MQRNLITVCRGAFEWATASPASTAQTAGDTHINFCQQ